MQRRDKVSQFGAFLPFGSGMVERVVYIIYRCLASQLQQRPGAVPEKGTRKNSLTVSEGLSEVFSPSAGQGLSFAEV